MVSQTEKKFHPAKKDIFGSFESFRCLLSSSSGSGKSRLLKTLLTDESFAIRDKFKVSNIYIFCPTIKVDPAWEDIINDFKSRSTRDDEFVESE